MLTFNCRPKESETLDMSLLPEVDDDDNDKLGMSITCNNYNAHTCFFNEFT